MTDALRRPSETGSQLRAFWEGAPIQAAVAARRFGDDPEALRRFFPDVDPQVVELLAVVAPKPVAAPSALEARRLFATAGTSLFVARFPGLGTSVHVYPDRQRVGRFVWVLWGPFGLDQVERGILAGGDVPAGADLPSAVGFAMARLLVHCGDAYLDRPDGALPPGLIEDTVG